jgi:hypothetical protein
MRLDADASTVRDIDVVPCEDYRDEPIGRVLADWAALSQGFNRVNRSMGLRDLYPFTITKAVQRKLGFVHDLITHAPLTTDEQVAIALAPREEERA